MTDPHGYQPLPRAWRAAEDSHGRIYFVDDTKQQTNWYDPRHNITYLKKYDKMGPNVVRIGFALYDIQQLNGFNMVDEAKLGLVIRKKEGLRQDSVKREILKPMLQEALKNSDSNIANKVTDKLMALFDIKYEGQIELRVAFLGLIFLSPISTYRKIELAFLVLDTKRTNRLDQSTLFTMFKTITKLIENPFYRYKLAISNRQIVSDVAGCLQTVKVAKGRESDGTITFSEFVNYAIDDPIILRPLSMLEKIQVSRATIHTGKKCTACNTSPIKGIRYKAAHGPQSMCEECFWKGVESGNFKRQDPYIEYPTEHGSQKKAAESTSGRFLPAMKRSGRARDDEALMPETIDPSGNFLNPNSISRSKSRGW